MAGIIFFRTEQRERITEFYTGSLGFERWLEQEGGCTILKRENCLVGFCDGQTETEGIITVVVPDREHVDELYEVLEERAEHEPRENSEFDIYQFFAADPDGRAVEVQAFLHETPPMR